MPQNKQKPRIYGIFDRQIQTKSDKETYQNSTKKTPGVIPGVSSEKEKGQ